MRAVSVVVRRVSALFFVTAALACSDAQAPAASQPAEAAPLRSTPHQRGGYSREQAAAYLDARVARWLDSPPPVANIECAMSCHTTFPAVLAHAHLPAEGTQNIARARARFEARLPSQSPHAIPFYGDDGDEKTVESHATEAVLAATALVLDDTSRGGALQPSTQEALERMWARQDDRGGWPWLDFGLEPWEHEDAFGVAMAALAAGRAPAHATASHATEVDKLRDYTRRHLATATLHDRVAILWASSALPGLLSERQHKRIVTALRSKQHDDGGFALADLLPSGAARPAADGYATALATLALCSSAEAREAAHAGRSWLASHQQDDGSWVGTSANGPGTRAQRYMTDAATAFAILALDECDAPPG